MKVIVSPLLIVIVDGENPESAISMIFELLSVGSGLCAGVVASVLASCFELQLVMMKSAARTQNNHLLFMPV